MKQLELTSTLAKLLRTAAPYTLALTGLLGHGCANSPEGARTEGAGPEIELASQVAALEDRVCTKDLEELSDIAFGLELGATCQVDTDCACGSACGANSRCVVECLDDDESLGCVAPKKCNGFGKCAVPATSTPPGTGRPLIDLSVAPTSIELPVPPPGGAWRETDVVIAVSVDSFTGTTPPSPRVEVSGALAKPVCPTDGTACAAATESELEVLCEGTGSFEQKCVFESGWAFTSEAGRKVAKRTVVVRPRATATDSAWQLRVFGDELTPSPQLVSIARLVAQPAAFEGRYQGTLSLRPETAATLDSVPLTLPVTAYAKGDALVLVEPARVLTRDTGLVLRRNAAFGLPWVVSAGGSNLSVGVSLVAFTQDPATGAISGSLDMGLPALSASTVPPVASSVDAPAHVSVAFKLAREADLPATSCTSNLQCGTGEVCETSVSVCLPSATAVPQSGAALNSSDSTYLTSWLSTMAAAFPTSVVNPEHITADTSERALCFPETGTAASHAKDLFGGAISDFSGDLRCADGSDSVFAPLVSSPRGVGLTLGQAFDACRAELTATPSASALGRPKCMSLARVMPALGYLLDAQLDTDARKPALMQYLLRTWLATHTSVAKQAVEHLDLQRTATNNTYTPEGLHDIVARAWDLVLDKDVMSALSELPRESLLAPDYRHTNRPLSYFPCPAGQTCTPIGEGSTQISGDKVRFNLPSAAKIFDGDFTIHFRTRTDPIVSRANKVLFAGDGFEVSLEHEGPSFWSQGARTFTNTSDTFFYRETGGFQRWSQCQEYCAQFVGGSVTWSFDPAGKSVNAPDTNTLGRCQCSLLRPGNPPSPNIGTHDESLAGAFSGVARDGVDNGGIPTDGTTLQANFNRVGVPFKTFTAADLTGCRRQCRIPNSTFQGPDQDRCVAYAFQSSNKECRLFGGDYNNPNELPLAFSQTGFSTGLGWRGLLIERAVKQRVQDNVLLQGTSYSNTQESRWDVCHDRCNADVKCKGWTFVKPPPRGSVTSQCLLFSAITSTISSDAFVSQKKPQLTLVVKHRTAAGVTEIQRLPTGRVGFFDGGITLVRDKRERTYRVYTNSELGSKVGYFADPVAAPATLEASKVNGKESVLDTHAPILDLAVFDTALDAAAVDGIKLRRANPFQFPKPVVVGTAATLGDEAVEARMGLPVAMLETLEAELELVEKLVSDRRGELAETCALANKDALNAVVARAGEALRRGLVVQSVAQSLFDKATVREWVPSCTEAVTCPPATQDIALSSLSARGAVQSCTSTGVPMSGLCVPAGTSPAVRPMPPATQLAPTDGVVARVQIPIAGRYRIRALVHTPSSDADSFWFRSGSAGAWEAWQLTGGSSRLDVGFGFADLGRDVFLDAGAQDLAFEAREPGTILRGLMVFPAESFACPCSGAPMTALRDAATWEKRYDAALAGYESARAELADMLAERAECAPVFGIDEAALPLYFRDPNGNSARYFASSDYLYGLAKQATDEALAAQNAARQTMIQQKEAVLSATLATTSAEARIEGIQNEYAASLRDLCGVSGMTSKELLESLDDADFRTSCFVRRTPQCLANFEGPVEDADVACYQGALGESFLTLRRMTDQVAAAKQVSDAKLAELERQSNFCLELDKNTEIVDAHYAHLARLRNEKALYDKMVKYFSLGGKVVGKQLSNALADGGSEPVSATPTPVSFVQVYTAIVTGIFSFKSQAVQDAIDEEQRQFEETMTRRGHQQAALACWNQVAGIRDAILGAEQQITLAGDAFEDATLRFANQRATLENLVANASTDIERETDRTVGRPQQIYWLGETIDRYESLLAWAKHLTFLTVRAVEYEHQTSLSLTRAILDARGAVQLSALVSEGGPLQSQLAIPLVNGVQPAPLHIVIDLARDVLGFSGDNASVERKLQAFLRDRAQRYVDDNGQVLGQAVRFSLNPEQTCTGHDLCLVLPHRCGERLWSVSAKLTGGTTNTMTTVSLEKSTSFYSQWCQPASHETETQQGYIRPQENLFQRGANHAFRDEATSLRADIASPLNGPVDLVNGPVAFPDTTFAGQGMYGDYLLLFRAGTSALDLSKVTSVQVRLDYLSVTGH